MCPQRSFLLRTLQQSTEIQLPGYSSITSLDAEDRINCCVDDFDGSLYIVLFFHYNLMMINSFLLRYQHYFDLLALVGP